MFALATRGHPNLAPSRLAKSDEPKTVPRHIVVILSSNGTFRSGFHATQSDLHVAASNAKRFTHNYLNVTEPRSITEVTMKTRVVKLGPGSWAVFINGQRHHELFLTRAAARSEAKRQNEADKIDNKS
jgi:hypothetical protein